MTRKILMFSSVLAVIVLALVFLTVKEPHAPPPPVVSYRAGRDIVETTPTTVDYPVAHYPQFEGPICVIPDGSVFVEGQVIPPGWNLVYENTGKPVIDTTGKYWWCHQ